MGLFFIQHWENRHLYSLSILNITVSMKKNLEAGRVAHVCDSGTLKTDSRGFPAQTSLNSKTIFFVVVVAKQKFKRKLNRYFLNRHVLYVFV